MTPSDDIDGFGQILNVEIVWVKVHQLIIIATVCSSYYGILSRPTDISTRSVYLQRVLFHISSNLFVGLLVGVLGCLLGCLFVCLLGCSGVCLFVCFVCVGVWVCLFR